MREVLISDVFRRNPKAYSEAMPSDFLTEYIAQGRSRGRHQADGGYVDQWRGRELEGPKLKKFIFDVSDHIDQAWEQEYIHAKGLPLPIGAYTRAVLVADKLALNVMKEARAMSCSDNSEESRVGKNVLFHRYLNSGLAAINLIRLQHSYFDFNTSPLVESAVEITNRIIFSGEEPTISIAHAVHTQVKIMTRSYLADLTGLPFEYIVSAGRYRDVAEFVSNHIREFADYPTADKISSEFPPLSHEDVVNLANSFRMLGEPTIQLRPGLKESLNKFYKQEKLRPEQVDERKELVDRLWEILDSLNGRKRRVLKLRFGLVDGIQRTLEEVGREFGSEKESIRQTEKRALKNVRQLLRSGRLEEYIYAREEKDNQRALMNGAVTALQQKDGAKALRNLLIIENEMPFLVAEAASDPRHPSGINANVDLLREVWKLQKKARQLLK